MHFITLGWSTFPNQQWKCACLEIRCIWTKPRSLESLACLLTIWKSWTERRNSLRNWVSSCVLEIFIFYFLWWKKDLKVYRYMLLIPTSSLWQNVDKLFLTIDLKCVKIFFFLYLQLRSTMLSLLPMSLSNKSLDFWVLVWTKPVNFQRCAPTKKNYRKRLTSWKLLLNSRWRR